jgi:general stress protein 26
MNNQEIKDKIRQIIQTIYHTCKEGKDFDRLNPYLHDEVVMVPPGMSAHAQSRDTCLRRYEDACSQMNIHKLDTSDEHIDIYGHAAVAYFKYACIWEFQGKKFDDTGHEILVFVRNDNDWQMAWRTLIPGSRQVEKSPTQEQQMDASVSKDMKQTCLSLMNNTPVCHLTTIDSDGFPHTSAMNNLRYAKQYPSLVKIHEEDDNDFVLYLSTNMQSPKMSRMQANSKVSVYFCNPDQIIGFMLGGEIEIISNQELKNRTWQKGWTMYYPNGPEGPEYGVIKLAPSVVKGWRQNGTFELKP